MQWVSANQLVVTGNGMEPTQVVRGRVVFLRVFVGDEARWHHGFGRSLNARVVVCPIAGDHRFFGDIGAVTVMFADTICNNVDRCRPTSPQCLACGGTARTAFAARPAVVVHQGDGDRHVSGCAKVATL